MMGPTTHPVGPALPRRSTPVALPVEPVGPSTTPARTE
jgi:hypothetical protein